jgi:hypothetical protein
MSPHITGSLPAQGPAPQSTPAPAPSLFDAGASFHNLLSQGVKDLFSSPTDDDEESDKE